MAPHPAADVPLVHDQVPPARDWAFIVGVGRAGTTALVKLINAHPDARMLNEAWLWGYVRILTSSRHDHGGPGPDDIRNERLLPERRPGAAGGPCWRASQLRTILEGMRAAVAPGAALFGDKKWGYRRHLADVQAVLPQCRLLAAVRDVWDITASLCDCGWFRQFGRQSFTPEELAAAAYEVARTALRDIASLPPGSVHTVSFEKMATAPEPAVRRLLAWLDLDEARFDWDVLDAVRYAQAVGHWERVPAVAALRAAHEAAGAQAAREQMTTT
jgi:hypothetical protein